MRKQLLTVLFAMICLGSMAQDDTEPIGKVTVTGSVQSDILIPSELTNDMPEHFLTNTYVDLRAMNRHLDVGLRFEYLDHPLPGFVSDFKGYGISNLYIKLGYKKWDLTLGSYYEQFGSGFILRTYEERSLGIDNSLIGIRMGLRPWKGVSMKLLTGTQRVYWDISRSLISGADVQLNLDEWIKPLSQHDTYLSLGASWVNKYQDKEEIFVAGDPTHRYNLPTVVNAFDARAQVQSHGFNILAEYAHKSQDPNYSNTFSYTPGDVAMLSASYSQKGLSMLVQAKRSDNMSFRSRRNEPPTKLSYDLNCLPPFTMDHTYSLAALYPYATNPNGEWAYQAEVGYKFKKGSAIGGKFGTSLKANFSHVRGLQKDSQTYYQDINIQAEKKFSKLFKLNLMYMNQRYNKTVVEGHGGMIRSNIYVADAKFQFTKKTTLRAELQYLETNDDDKDWVFGLLELSLAPHWMLTVSDQWNCGVTDEHYYQGLLTFNYNAHRLQAGYGRTREGFNCTGGVCRRVPETKGFTLSYNFNF